MYKFLINLLSLQSIPVPFRICVNLVQLIRSNVFCQSMKQTHNSTSNSKVRSDIILSIPIASLVLFPLLTDLLRVHPQFSFNLSSKYLCYCLCCMCDKADCAMVAAFYGFFFKTIIVTSVKSLGRSPVSYMALINFFLLFSNHLLPIF